MTPQPPDVSWLRGEYGEECYSFIYVRATPEQVVTRLGGRWEDFTPGPLPDDPDDFPQAGEPLGVASLGDWTLVFDTDWLGTCEDVITELSRGTRLVSQAALAIKGLDYFFWCEDGEIKFGWGYDEEDLAEIPDELMGTMMAIGRLYPSFPDLYEGPAFLLVEHLTGIMPSKQLLKDATFLWGVVPRPATG